VKRAKFLAYMPAGYTLYQQIFTPSNDGASSTNADTVTGWQVRTDAYLYGHPYSENERYVVGPSWKPIDLI
jgi:hypothetical protein